MGCPKRCVQVFSDYKAHLTVLPSQIEIIEEIEQDNLEHAYDYSLNLFKLHAKSFYFASRYLEEKERRAFAALYGFCRLADDFVDEINLEISEIDKELDILKDMTSGLAKGKTYNHPLFLAFGDTMIRYKIPVRYLHELIEGVRMDVNLDEIKTEKELEKYCYHVASTVGLMMCHIWGSTRRDTLERAADLGHALQLTNILRDVAEDYDNGRIYIPLETRELFRVTANEFELREVRPNFQRLIEHEIHRARTLYARSEVGIPDLPPAGQFTVKVASRVYASIMSEIEKMDYQVFKKRAIVPKWKKIWIAYRVRSEYLREKKAYERKMADGIRQIA
ncbi:MAG: hypothetical protein BAJATHORv1_60024 [Candidatus Thorarchaeota archaeon]|nr:MAG: hypothetical protein BAJATHORv1_60024 [Candidatus Thorarchaeota archaeon]